MSYNVLEEKRTSITFICTCTLVLKANTNHSPATGEWQSSSKITGIIQLDNLSL